MDKVFIPDERANAPPVPPSTFAAMMLTPGADLYVTSKLPGRSNVKTTQVYCRFVDSKKVDAVNQVDDVID